MNAPGGVRAIPIRLSEHVSLEADLAVPPLAQGVVLMLPRDARYACTADVFHAAGLATVQADLLTADEALVDALIGVGRFDIDLQSARALALIDWVEAQDATGALPLGLFGAGPGAAAALAAAADQPSAVRAVVGYDGQPDLAGPALRWVQQPTLLLVGLHDEAIFELNRRAILEIPADVRLEILPDDLTGAVPETAAALARDWFLTHL